MNDNKITRNFQLNFLSGLRIDVSLRIASSGFLFFIALAPTSFWVCNRDNMESSYSVLSLVPNQGKCNGFE